MEAKRYLKSKLPEDISMTQPGGSIVFNKEQDKAEFNAMVRTAEAAKQNGETNSLDVISPVLSSSKKLKVVNAGEYSRMRSPYNHPKVQIPNIYSNVLPKNNSDAK